MRKTEKHVLLEENLGGHSPPNKKSVVDGKIVFSIVNY
jgi:hypothetical protein